MLKRLRKFLHDVLGWHDGKGVDKSRIWCDGASLHSTCSQCGREVMLDSQGNWFTFN